MSSPILVGTTVYTSLVFGLFIVGFWDSTEELSALVLVASSVLAFFCIQPFLLSLPDWRFAVKEEAEALLHTSLTLSRFLKALMAILLTLIVLTVEFAFINIVTDFGTLSSLATVRTLRERLRLVFLALLRVASIGAALVLVYCGINASDRFPVGKQLRPEEKRRVVHGNDSNNSVKTM